MRQHIVEKGRWVDLAVVVIGVGLLLRIQQ